MPFAGYSDFNDCVAQNSGKSNPQGYCATVMRQTEMRHTDFQRIHDEFVKYYKNPVIGESEYYSWLNDLHCNETKPYGYSLESFTWSKDMLRFAYEDQENKYYEILVGLPIVSINNNPYSERDLIAASLTLKGKSPSLNHKDEFWFSPKNPKNKWGNLTVVEGKYQDGASGALLKVPKTAICPICNGDKMTELIDKKRIVNVSLEGTNEGAFEYGDPPFTLLTSDVLPGIPLARIKPLERIVEQYVIGTKIPGSKRMKIEAKIKEDGLNDAPPAKDTAKPDQHMQCPEGTMYSAAKGGCVPMDQQEEPVSTMAKVEADLAKTSMGTPAVQDGDVMQSGSPMGDKMKGYEQKQKEDAVQQGKWNAPSTKTNDTSQPKPEDVRSGPTRSKAPDRGTPEGGSSPRTADLAKTVTGVSPYEKLVTTTAEKAIFIAELGESNAKQTIEKLDKRNTELLAERDELRGEKKQLELVVKQANEQKDNAIKEMYNAESDRDKHKRFYEEEAGERRKTERLLLEVKNRLDDVNSKYNDALGVNLDLSKKLTSANEDYLEIAKQKEHLEDTLTLARTNAKKTLKLRI